jgi:glutamine synthetase
VTFAGNRAPENVIHSARDHHPRWIAAADDTNPVGRPDGSRPARGRRPGECASIAHVIDLVRRAEQAGTRIVRFEFCDYSGIVHAKAIHVSLLDRKLREGIGSTLAQTALNVRDELIDIPEMPPVGEVRIVPDPATYAELPWAPGVASVVCDLIDRDHTPWFACTRSFLRRQVEAAATLGITVRATFELEFYLCHPGPDGDLLPLPRRPVYSSIGLDDHQPAISAIVDALVRRGIAVEGILNEYGAGQHELSVAPEGPQSAADTQIALRDTVRGVAITHGYRASFAPKPFLDQIGSGAHLHLSLWRDGRNVLHDPNRPEGLSEAGRGFVGGLVEHLPALLGVTCPSVNSFQRLQPDSWSGVYHCWGFDNREAPVRVASPYWGREERTTNVELKAVDGSCNPHLALGGALAAGLDGIARGLDPGAPVAVNPARLDSRPPLLPLSLDVALGLLESDAVLAGAMGQPMLSTYLALKRSEVAAYAGAEPETIAAEYRYKY